MVRYSIDPKTRKFVEEYGFLSFWKNFSNKYKKQLLDVAKKQDYNHGHNILRMFDVLPNFLFTTSEMKLG